MSQHEIRLKVFVPKNKRGDVKYNPAIKKIEIELRRAKVAYSKQIVVNTSLKAEDNFLPEHHKEFLKAQQHTITINEDFWINCWKAGKFNLSRQDVQDIIIYKWED